MDYKLETARSYMCGALMGILANPAVPFNEDGTADFETIVKVARKVAIAAMREDAVLVELMGGQVEPIAFVEEQLSPVVGELYQRTPSRCPACGSTETVAHPDTPDWAKCIEPSCRLSFNLTDVRRYLEIQNAVKDETIDRSVLIDDEAETAGNTTPDELLILKVNHCLKCNGPLVLVTPVIPTNAGIKRCDACNLDYKIEGNQLKTRQVSGEQ